MGKTHPEIRMGGEGDVHQPETEGGVRQGQATTVVVTSGLWERLAPPMIIIMKREP